MLASCKQKYLIWERVFFIEVQIKLKVICCIFHFAFLWLVPMLVDIVLIKIFGLLLLLLLKSFTFLLSNITGSIYVRHWAVVSRSTSDDCACLGARARQLNGFHWVSASSIDLKLSRLIAFDAVTVASVAATADSEVFTDRFTGPDRAIRSGVRVRPDNNVWTRWPVT